MKHETAIKYPICLNGFKTKTINVRTTAGGTKFFLQQINELGLPRDAQIQAIWARSHDSTQIASNGLPLVDTAVFENGYISLKDRANSKNEINLLVSDYHVPRLTELAMFVQPVPSKLIDWNQSFVRINPRATAVDNAIFEFIIIYSDPCDNQEFPNRFLFRDGLELSGKRIASFEVSVNSTQTEYSLSNSDNVGLPTDAIVLGFTTINNANPLYGSTGFDSDALKSTYITFKQGTCSIIDEFPASIDKYDQVIDAIKYFPIVPTDVLAMDWQQSKFVIKDMTNIVNGMVFQFSIIWWSPNC